MNESWKLYGEGQMMGANPIEITIFAYERSILFLKSAQKDFIEMHFMKGKEKVGKVEAVFRDMKLGINPDADPELADQLYNLYDWIIEELYMSSIQAKPEKLDPVIKVIRDLLEGYKEAVKIHEQNS